MSIQTTFFQIKALLAHCEMNSLFEYFDLVAWLKIQTSKYSVIYNFYIKVIQKLPIRYEFYFYISEFSEKLSAT